MKNSCYIYLRVSTDEQAKEGFSLDNQKRACLEYAKTNGYSVKDVFSEDGKSARTTDRPEFQRLLASLKEKTVEAIVVYKIDRFARNVADYSNYRKQFKSDGIKLLSVNEGDVTEGLIGGIFALVAEWESEVNGKRTKDAMSQKFREGSWPGWAPLGYKNVEKNDRRFVIPDEIIGPLITQLFELYATGSYSYLSLSKEMNKKGLTARKSNNVMCDSSLQKIIANSFYYGWMKWGGMEKTGIHKPLVSKTLFEQCQLVAAKHRQFLVRERKHDFLLRGVVFCQKHGSRLTAEWHKYHHDHYKKDKIGYYHCHQQGGCPGSFINTEELEKDVADLIKRYQFDQKFIDLVKQKVRDQLNDGRKTVDSEKQAITNRKKVIEQKRNNLEDLLVEGAIERTAYQRQHLKLQGEIDVLDNESSELENRRNLDVTLIDEVLALTRNIYQTYLDAPTYLKRHYLKFFFEAIYINNKEIAKIVESPMFSTLRTQNYIIIRNNWLAQWNDFRTSAVSLQQCSPIY